MNLDRNELKIQALSERIAQLTAEYENKVADLRVELTVISQELQEANAEATPMPEPEATRSQDEEN